MTKTKTDAAHKIVYGVSVTVGKETKFLVVPADNKSQAIRIAAEGIITARVMTPWEVLSYEREQQKQREDDANSAKVNPEYEGRPAVGGLPAGDI